MEVLQADLYPGPLFSLTPHSCPLGPCTPQSRCAAEAHAPNPHGGGEEERACLAALQMGPQSRQGSVPSADMLGFTPRPQHQSVGSLAWASPPP